MNQISPLNTENPDGWCYIEDKNIIKTLKNQIIWHFLSNSGSSEPNPAFSNTKPWFFTYLAFLHLQYTSTETAIMAIIAIMLAPTTHPIAFETFWGASFLQMSSGLWNLKLKKVLFHLYSVRVVMFFNMLFLYAFMWITNVMKCNEKLWNLMNHHETSWNIVKHQKRHKTQ